MKEQKKDRRVQRTRNLLHEALQDLMVEKGYEAITVQDLIDRANIGRSTFYSHFVDKEELLAENVNILSELLKEQIDKSETKKTEVFRFKFSLSFLKHVQESKHLWKATVAPSGMFVLHHIKRVISDLVQEEILISNYSNSSLIPQDIAVDFVVNTLMSLIHWWMNGEEHIQVSAVDVDEMFHRLVLSGLDLR
ncbi:TetR/AcrR family transcriptional regulator [Chengkuizengella axinellae]|uniref:TetR/AcrR family transcriptional regulator n=1 Tax=Chengkuizengella axinellae TaxID=3064388 RepID=A0ABT9IXQ7_9BACL|nr:TetR/AcrR family transcriptional regulator [Chengkuizengella sp. 2205SS18-9]MDP5274107.1 TetR/AcrR family transcriptional regulator [Chengkuizengella sp. 2205SS18-9]